MRSRFTNRLVFVAAWFALPALVVPAAAHEKKAAGPVHLVIGWGAEPAFSGARNSVEVAVLDAAGRPVTDPIDDFSAQVSFGDQAVELPLRAAGDRPGVYRAWLVPTRAGTYAFHVSGRIKGQAIDVTSTCSDRTFDCVIDPSELQFPAKDPSVAELAERLGRSVPRADRAVDAATRAWWLSAVALACSGLALALLGAVVLKRGAAAGK